jgi:hypothetical protein
VSPVIKAASARPVNFKIEKRKKRNETNHRPKRAIIKQHFRDEVFKWSKRENAPGRQPEASIQHRSHQTPPPMAQKLAGR